MANLYTFGVAMFAAIGTFLFVRSPSNTSFVEYAADVTRVSILE